MLDTNDGYTTEEKTPEQENFSENKLEAQESVEARKSVRMQKSMQMQTRVGIQENNEVLINLTEQKSFGNQMSIENGAEGRKSEVGRVSFACQLELQEQKSFGVQQSFQEVSQQESMSATMMGVAINDKDQEDTENNMIKMKTSRISDDVEEDSPQADQKESKISQGKFF